MSGRTLLIALLLSGLTLTACASPTPVPEPIEASAKSPEQVPAVEAGASPELVCFHATW